MGLVVSMLINRLKISRKTKLLLYFGVIALVVSFLIPVLANLYYERNRKVLVTENNLTQISFQKEWNLVQTTLDMPGNAKLNRFNMNYQENGDIIELNYELVALVNGNYTLYRVNFNSPRNVYIIKPKKVSQWVQYDRLVPAERFFQVLDSLDFIKNKPVGDYVSYGIFSTGDFITYGIENHQKYFVKDGDIKIINNRELPIEGFMISTCGNKRMDKGIEGTGYIDYLFH